MSAVGLIIFAVLSGVALIVLATFFGLWLISDTRLVQNEEPELDVNELTPHEKKRLEEILNDRLIELQKAKFAPPIVRPARTPPPPIGSKSSTELSNVFQFGKKNRGEK